MATHCLPELRNHRRRLKLVLLFDAVPLVLSELAVPVEVPRLGCNESARCLAPTDTPVTPQNANAALLLDAVLQARDG